jgi:nucleoid DNA-binding protein
MTKSILTAQIVQHAGLDAAHAGQLVDIMIDTIANELTASGRFSLLGLGTFNVRDLGARKGHHPGTGAPMQIKASRTVRFKPAETLREAVAAPPPPRVKELAKTAKPPRAAKPPKAASPPAQAPAERRRSPPGNGHQERAAA